MLLLMGLPIAQLFHALATQSAVKTLEHVILQQFQPLRRLFEDTFNKIPGLLRRRCWSEQLGVFPALVARCPTRSRQRKAVGPQPVFTD